MKQNQHKPILELQRILIAVKMDQLMILDKEPIASFGAMERRGCAVRAAEMLLQRAAPALRTKMATYRRSRE